MLREVRRSLAHILPFVHESAAEVVRKIRANSREMTPGDFLVLLELEVATLEAIGTFPANPSATFNEWLRSWGGGPLVQRSGSLLGVLLRAKYGFVARAVLLDE